VFAGPGEFMQLVPSTQTPLSQTLVKPLGYFWEHVQTHEEIPVDEFPPANNKRRTAPILNSNDLRDRSIFDQRRKGIEWKAIVKNVNNVADFEPFIHDTLQGRIDAARKAMTRYCQRHSKNIPSRDHKRTRHD
jgi:hypothetical protein